ncbi:MAG: D-alanyl-D-alanine carboxypeptidase/D-alanyl-D-alanine-endopeptidase, partial [Actinobacteria bacterium]|nr:D-alanyl-D-alanine carboxypeptidase/D-alanyl-D-alanine-endopeptidase [Actinomycetota bacterium]
EPLFSHRPDVPFIPASNEKLAVTFAALALLGPEFRFRTDVIDVGRRQGPAWVGDLFLRGTGDPTFVTRGLERLVAVLRGRGIREVTGRVFGDESLFDDVRDAPGWKPSFLGDESPPLSALVLDRGRGWPAFTPPKLAARALERELEGAGIAVEGVAGVRAAPVEAGTILASVESDRLAEIVALANTESDNFVAEMLLKHLGTIGGDPGSTAGGARVVRRTLSEAGVPLTGVRLVDGSGLSRLNRLTPRALVEILRAGVRSPAFGAAFRRSLAVAGRTGTLERRLRGLHGAVRGKTGTTSLACTISGTIRSRIAFAVLENGNPVPTTAARAAQDRFALVLDRSF